MIKKKSPYLKKSGHSLFYICKSIHFSETSQALFYFIICFIIIIIVNLVSWSMSLYIQFLWKKCISKEGERQNCAEMLATFAL